MSSGDIQRAIIIVLLGFIAGSVLIISVRLASIEQHLLKEQYSTSQREAK